MNLLVAAEPAVRAGDGAVDGRFPVTVAARHAGATRGEEAADPSAFALKVRRQLTDERANAAPLRQRGRDLPARPATRTACACTS